MDVKKINSICDKLRKQSIQQNRFSTILLVTELNTLFQQKDFFYRLFY